ncbi:hypothetical protein [Vagococcus humatus]|uniref:Uncharacterized protein n=1 Tax=Vagococcus humatus TaxID=1889241 RepID=A0A429Z692_9ENTE|nr:hypothetical protein [Vagococcus humatus]RST89215.1 hypothetical protein C7P63_05415 [Vagococcus humatus]
MKNLNRFLNFDTESFFEDKSLAFIADKGIDEKIGLHKVELIIMEDNTDYSEVGLNEESINQYEKFICKLIQPPVDFKRNNSIKIVNISKATVWGDYSTGLSVTAEKIEKVIKLSK